MSSFSGLIRSRYATQYADPVTNATLVSNIFPAAVALREELAATISASSRVTVDGDLLALLDAIVAASAQDVVEAAIETLRITQVPRSHQRGAKTLRPRTSARPSFRPASLSRIPHQAPCRLLDHGRLARGSFVHSEPRSA